MRGATDGQVGVQVPPAAVAACDGPVGVQVPAAGAACEGLAKKRRLIEEDVEMTTTNHAEELVASL